MRLFVAIALAEAVERELASAVARLRAGASAGGLRWMAPDSWHLTLEFLGNTTPGQFSCLTARLGEVRSAPVPVELDRLGCFERAGVLFAEVRATPGLAALADAVVAAAGRCGFPAESRPFCPHITLARTKGQGRGGSLRSWAASAGNLPPFSRYTAREFLLYESHLGDGGARYEVRGRFPLNGAG